MNKNIIILFISFIIVAVGYLIFISNKSTPTADVIGVDYSNERTSSKSSNSESALLMAPNVVPINENILPSANIPGFLVPPGFEKVMTPKEAGTIAHAILKCDSIRFMPSIEIPENEAGIVIDKECERMNSENSIYILAKFSAESGDSKAQLEFPALAALAFNDEKNAMNPEMIEDYKYSSLRFLQAAAKNGEDGALLQLSNSYESGLFSRQDPVLAYAYAHAYARRSVSQRAHQLADKLSNNLTAAEVEKAREIAKIL